MIKIYKTIRNKQQNKIKNKQQKDKQQITKNK